MRRGNGIPGGEYETHVIGWADRADIGRGTNVLNVHGGFRHVGDKPGYSVWIHDSGMISKGGSTDAILCLKGLLSKGCTASRRAMMDDRRYVIDMSVDAMPARAEVRLRGYENGQGTVNIASGDEV